MPTDDVRLLAAWGAAMLLAGPAPAAQRVLSFDQCADQYVLALAPRASIVGLSRRALNADSYLRDKAAGLPRLRATAESALGATPTMVVRYWGGEPRLVEALERRGVEVVTLDDATDFPGVRVNIRRVAAAFGRAAAGEALIARMDRELAAAAGAGGGRGVLYVTSGGDTMGRGTLVDAMLRAAGFANLAARAGFGVISLERLALAPPALLVLGFFDQNMAAYERWSIGRQPVLRSLIARRAAVSLPAAILGCPAWFAADGSRDLAAWGRRH
ncbi:MAG TPA: ABC transporter substrate-binding protein [Caulobacteraceae bacterium]|nr:ABC transporter substrate-binding protein [Caulobacteraceae bacterium]